MLHTCELAYTLFRAGYIGGLYFYMRYWTIKVCSVVILARGIEPRCFLVLVVPLCSHAVVHGVAPALPPRQAVWRRRQAAEAANQGLGELLAHRQDALDVESQALLEGGGRTGACGHD